MRECKKAYVPRNRECQLVNSFRIVRTNRVMDILGDQAGQDGSRYWSRFRLVHGPGGWARRRYRNNVPISCAAAVLIFFIAGLLYLLRFERVDNLGAYRIQPETGLLIPSDYDSWDNRDTFAGWSYPQTAALDLGSKNDWKPVSRARFGDILREEVATLPPDALKMYEAYAKAEMQQPCNRLCK
jgi:hypothetical protein